MTQDEVSIEAKLLLHILRQPISGFEDSPSKHNFLQLKEVDYEKFVDLVDRNGLAGLVYLRIHKSTFLPAETAEILRSRYRQTALSNLAQLAELLEVLDAFNAHEIDVIPLKGVVDAEKLFGDLGSYPSSDIDLLVPEEQLSTICSMLNGYGYNAIEEIEEADLLFSHYHLIYRKKAACLELHWTLVKRYFNSPKDFWWEGVTKRTYEGREIIELAPEKYLLYLIFRLFDHQFSPLKFWMHLSAFITQSTHLDWDKLFWYADLFGMKRLVVFSLQFAHEQFGTPVPAQLGNTKVWGYSILRNLILEQNFSESSKPHFAMLCFTCLSLPPKILIRCILPRVFASKSEIRLRYGLNSKSKTVYIYMIFNPLLMLLRRK
ncbi:nucleotidyltransferase family protein [Desulfosediminicola flagellatus]|uniref:nucleotidyltransferase domain-containing protein n=1 Tax=Desulfosediminicola flagellatus TaxID=2569541 RepID=UPI0010AC788D|nr:nucleotidyltransferase family protein [Desulfosediminicola flagellatus]